MQKASNLNKYLSIITQVDTFMIIALSLIFIVFSVSGFPFAHYDDEYLDFIDQHTDLDSLKDYSKKLITRSNISHDRIELFTTIIFWCYLIVVIILVTNLICIQKVKKTISDHTDVKNE